MTFPTAALDSLGTIQTGSTPSTSDESLWGGDLPFVTPAELDQPKPILAAPRTLTDAGAAQARVLKKDAVLVCCIGSLGKVGFAGRNLVTNQQINSIEFDEKLVFPKYGFYACQRLKPKLATMAPATTVPIVNKSKFGQLEIPLPPLPEQRRIAAILDKADALRTKRREALAELDRLAQSIFVEMFGDPVTNPNRLAKEALGDLMKVKSGDFLPASEMAADGQYPVFGGKGVNGHHNTYMFDCRHIVIGRVGVYCGCVHVTPEFFWVTDNALYVSEHDSKIAFDFLAYSLRLANLNQYASQSAQPLISGARIYPVEILVPPKERQAEFIARVNAAKRLSERFMDSSTGLNRLFATLQHRAFRGEL